VEPESSLGSVTTAAARIAIQSIRAELDLELEDLALVHRAVAVRHIVERTAAVEDAAGLDPPLEHVGQQPLDVGAYRCGGRRRCSPSSTLAAVRTLLSPPTALRSGRFRGEQLMLPL
jgi:hypothetical protein